MTVRTGGVALRISPRVSALTLFAVVGVVLVSLWAMTLGSFAMSWADAMAAARGHGTADQVFVVQTLRLPRIMAGILIGASLAVAGAIFQGVVRNPLVSPDIIGIDSGASLVAVYWIVTGQPWVLLPLAAFAGSLITAALIYVLAWKRGVDTDRLILVGIGVGAVVVAGVTFLTVRYPVEIVRPAEFWLMGSLSGSTWRDVITLLVGALVLVPSALVLARPLRTLQLGDDVTRGLGVPLERLRLGLIVIGCGLAAAAVSIAGPIAFVALMVPHVARMLAGPVSGGVLLFTTAIGALFLVSADVVAQHGLPVALPVGAITAAVGAPYFLFLLYRSHARS
ncbi:MAG: FecCD family ABC transporter permease [Thermomicrobiales bacterium]